MTQPRMTGTEGQIDDAHDAAGGRDASGEGAAGALTGHAIIAGFGWRFWRGRGDITLLIVGLVQALFGVIVYIQRYHVHG